MERLSAKARAITRIAVTFLFALGSPILSGPLHAQTTILFQTTESSFSPEITDTNAGSFLWTWADSNTSTDYPVATTSASPGVQTLTLSSPAPLASINLGFDGGDSGWTNNFDMRGEQGVAAVIFSAPLTALQLFAASHNPITNTLDFSGFTALQDIECFDCTNVQHVVVTNLPSLRRICFEDNDLQELDLYGDSNLEDVRGALNAFSEIKVDSSVGPKIWHWCFRDNPNITQQFATEVLTNFYSLREPWFWRANQKGALSFVSSNLTDVEVFGNQYDFADFTGQSNMFELLIADNLLTNLVVSNCKSLQILDARNNYLPTWVLDNILAVLDSSAHDSTHFPLQFLDLSENYECPSSAGMSHYAHLTNRFPNAVTTADVPDPNAGQISYTNQTDPPGLTFTVDGKTYTSTQVFHWKAGSTHTISTTRAQNSSSGTQYLWNGWDDGGPLSHVIAPRFDGSRVAQFMTNPFPPMKGKYIGLFAEPGVVRHVSSGFISLSLTDRGTYSGSINIAGTSSSISGQFDLQGHATNIIASGARITLAIDVTGGGNGLTGTVSAQSWVAALQGFRGIFDARTNPATALAAKYTAVIPGADGETTVPAGDGVATFTIDAGGKLTLAGTLADGTAFRQTGFVSETGDFPLYIPFSGRHGSLVGWLSIVTRDSDDVHGSLVWTRLNGLTTKFYALGFTNANVNLVGSRYQTPGAGSAALNFGNAAMAFSGGNLSTPSTNMVTLAANNKISMPLSKAVALTIASANGQVTGTAIPPSFAKGYAVKGVALQKQNSIAGFMLVTNQSSRVLISP
jgi:hypothetical protein